MGKKQRDCAGCGAPVGIIGREHCCRCEAKIREAAAKAECPGCGKQRVLQDETGRCMLCSRCCRECGHPVRRDETPCAGTAAARPGRRGPAALPALRPPRVSARGNRLVRPLLPAPPAERPAPRMRAVRAGQTACGAGNVFACFQRRPDRAFVAGAGLAARLASPPDWLDGFIAHLAARLLAGPGRQLITALGRLLDEDGQPAHPQALIERARWPGRSMGPLARGLETFFTEHGLALPTDHAEQLAAGRRQRRIDAVPGPLRPAVDGFARSMLAARERARRAGTRPRSDHTIETALATVRDLALFLADERGKQDWALADVHDVEAFLATLPRGRKRRLTVLRQFFRFARSRKIILADPHPGPDRPRTPRVHRPDPCLDEQRELFRRWTTAGTPSARGTAGDPRAAPRRFR